MKKMMGILILSLSIANASNVDMCLYYLTNAEQSMDKLFVFQIEIEKKIEKNYLEQGLIQALSF